MYFKEKTPRHPFSFFSIPLCLLLLPLFFFTCAPLPATEKDDAVRDTGKNHPPLKTIPELPALPQNWDVSQAFFDDVTGDGTAEWVLVIWQPWRDWPIQRWIDAESPIASYHDEHGQSCHLVVLDPTGGRLIWAGSALPHPLVILSIRDGDGNGINDIFTLRGDYAAGRSGTGTHVDTWEWDDFGFVLKGSSPLR
jgi:hypothetical protein